jgi:hypothetical protein
MMVGVAGFLSVCFSLATLLMMYQLCQCCQAFSRLQDRIPDSAGDGFCPRSPSAPIFDPTQTEHRLQHFSFTALILAHQPWPLH